MSTDNSETFTEDDIRRIASEAARDEVEDLTVEDEDGETWTPVRLAERFQVKRRTAFKAMGLIAVGYSAPRAVLMIYSRTAEAAPQDNLTVPGTLDAGALDTDKVTGAGRPYSTADDLSDVSVFLQRKSPTSQTDYVLLDQSDGPKTLLRAQAFGTEVQATGGTAHTMGPLTVDGTVNSTYPTTSPGMFFETTDDFVSAVIGYPIHYDSSLKLEWGHDGSGNDIVAAAFVAGSGPYWAAVVRDGKEPYMVARNLSDEQINNMGSPDGYHVEKNPTVSDSLDSVWIGIWDESQNKFVAP